MRINNRGVMVSMVILAVGFAVSCERREVAPAESSQTPTQPGRWQGTMPAEFKGLELRDGGACYLDAVNGAGIEDGPKVVKAGSAVSLAGWAVADVKAGRLGSAIGIQLNSATPYFIGAETYVRPGLGAALKAPALDGGGVKLDSTPLNVPVGDYRVLFLIQSDRNLLRCDTGRTLRVQ
jgi:hypothetical protein